MSCLSVIRLPTFWILALMIIAGCSGIEPLELTNSREEGPEKGLFSGSEGEFVIYRENGKEATRDGDNAVEKEIEKPAQ